MPTKCTRALTSMVLAGRGDAKGASVVTPLAARRSHLRCSKISTRAGRCTRAEPRPPGGHRDGMVAEGGGKLKLEAWFLLLRCDGSTPYFSANDISGGTDSNYPAISYRSIGAHFLSLGFWACNGSSRHVLFSSFGLPQQQLGPALPCTCLVGLWLACENARCGWAFRRSHRRHLSRNPQLA